MTFRPVPLLRATVLAAAFGWLASTTAMAQNTPMMSYQPSNVAQLSAEGSVDVQQDMLRITLSTSRQGKDAQTVQNQLKQALDAALQVARGQQQEGAMEVQTGNFSLYPSRDQNGRITQWQGSTELILSGKDIDRVSRTADRITTLTIADVGFDISKELRQRTEAQAQERAIAAFRDKANTIARSFGFSNYSLREVSVNAEGFYGGAPKMMTARAMSADAAAELAVQPGKSTVRVMVNGSVQMSR